MLKVIHVFVLWAVMFRAFTESEVSMLTPDRPQHIRFFFTHLTPFDDMTHVWSRSQRMGFRYKHPIRDRTRFPIWPNLTVELKTIVNEYIKAAQSDKDGQHTMRFAGLLRSIFKGTQKDTDYFLHHLLNDAEKINSYRPYNFYLKEALDEQLHVPRKPVIHEPLFMVVLRAWRVFFLLEISSSHDWLLRYPNGRPLYSGVLSKIHDEWSLLFIEQVCKVFHEQGYLLPNGFCPNPCAAQPCFSVLHSASAKCISTGFEPHEYECKCQPGHAWLKPSEGSSVGSCEFSDRCRTYCDQEGTYRCDVVEKREICVCRPSHMGPRCNVTRDPCIEHSDPSMMSGNAACNTLQGGQCIGIPGSNSYQCKCSHTQIADAFFPFPNCLGLRDKCLSVPCVHGDCISSRDGQETYCVCSEQFFGEFCDRPRGKWAEWSPWSECSPSCGISEYRRRTRTRDCLGEACRGGEGHIQIQLCDNRPCPDEILAMARRAKMSDMSDLRTELLQAEVARIVKLAGAVGQALLLISCLFSVAVATAMVITVFLM
ncbi:hypothetical protein EG68_09799 [Paragonimus skrjabini miyazakii]|uniref:EGF-like domain-containing protein n=1 Tax=Paragonimus skrjabini miyazakii TaxID=59628 RepID=A0A8S9YQ88_9TREM|nr:hypothetical protein EG68_09799 [Paragonimus skrjabini miyazakii]